MSNFMPVRYYLLYNLKAFISCIILNYKNLQFKQFIDDITIDLQFSRNFASIKNIRSKYNFIVDLSKFTFNKKILNKVVILIL